jgi:hypothetical protein
MFRFRIVDPYTAFYINADYLLLIQPLYHHMESSIFTFLVSLFTHFYIYIFRHQKWVHRNILEMLGTRISSTKRNTHFLLVSLLLNTNPDPGETNQCGSLRTRNRNTKNCRRVKLGCRPISKWKVEYLNSR